MEAKRIELGRLIRGNMQATVRALGSSAVQSIFTRADADGNGVLSRAEATDLLMELQVPSPAFHGLTHLPCHLPCHLPRHPPRHPPRTSLTTDRLT